MTRQHPFWRQNLVARLLELQQELGQILARQGPAAGPAPEGPEAPTELDPSTWDPALDLVEDAEQVRLWVDLPGVDPASIDLTVTGNVLSLRGRRGPVEEANTGRSHVLERPVGPFARQVLLPCEVDVDQAAAHARDGVLEVRLPKAEAVRPQTIPIRPA